MKEFYKIPFTTKDNHHVELAVLTCIDPRFPLLPFRSGVQGLPWG